MFPKLRAVDAMPITLRGQRAILLRDPLGLADRQAVLPERLAPLLMLCDGTRDAAGLRASLMIRHGLRVSIENVEMVLRGLDEALLFENDRFAQAVEAATDAYRSGPYREPLSAPASYPVDPGELRDMLDGYLSEVAPWPQPSGKPRGLVSPHIDFARGGPTYAQVWSRAELAAREAEVAIVFGTDHRGREGSITLTGQHYATPYGVLPAPSRLVDRLAAVLGPDHAFAGELHHRSEHSVELAAVWLHHMRAGEAIDMVAVLCGSFGRFIRGEATPGSDPFLEKFIEAVRAETAGRNALFVAAADLAHVGPAFGGRPVDLVTRARVEAADNEIIEATCAGDAGGVVDSVKSRNGKFNVCGVAPIYFVLRALAPAQGEKLAYAMCPADDASTSFVSICGVALT
jgi:AmmeMemoRadiSam system protein B